MKLSGTTPFLLSFTRIKYFRNIERHILDGVFFVLVSGHLLVNEIGLNPAAAPTFEISNKSGPVRIGNTFSTKTPVFTSQPAMQITPFMSLLGKHKTINDNSFGRVIGSNLVTDKVNPKNLMSLSNTFDVKMEPFVASETLRSRIPSSNTVGSSGKGLIIGLDAFMNPGPGVSDFFDMSQFSNPNLLPIGDIKQSFSRFTLPQIVLTPSPLDSGNPSEMIATTSPAPNIPVIKTTPQVLPPTKAVTRAPPSLFQYQDQNPTPSQTADMIIQSLVENKDATNGLIPELGQLNGVAADVNPKVDIIPEITPTKGVGIQFPGPTVAETLAFLKKEVIEPPRTYEEHLNPVFQMFDGTPPATGRTKSVSSLVTQTTISPKEAFLRAEMAAMRGRFQTFLYFSGQ